MYRESSRKTESTLLWILCPTYLETLSSIKVTKSKCQSSKSSEGLCFVQKLFPVKCLRINDIKTLK